MLEIINSRYVLQHEIGKGGMGVVFRATDRLTQDTVALKQVTTLFSNLQIGNGVAGGATEDDLRLALANEFQILAGLRHPHIISVLDYGFDDMRQPFFTMTYLPESQNILGAAEDASFDRKIKLIRQLLQALAYLHRRGVLHRDLKPDNVLVVDGIVRVLDFGLSASEENRGGSSAGTPLYMAPELFDGIAYSETADLYAVGVLLYQLLTGQHPFAPFDYAFLDRVLDEEPDLEKVDERLRPFIAHLLAKQPADRIASADGALTALASALGQPLPAESVAIRESYLQAAKFVGRETEIAKLTVALQKATNSYGSAWLIGGESGVGKSRLIDKIQTKALVTGFQLLRGQATSGGGESFQLWRQPLRQLVVSLPEIDELSASVLLPLIPDISELLARSVEPAIELDDGDAQVRLLTTIARLFMQAERPVLLILEDLHWASESLLLLPYLTRTIADRQLLLLGTYRSDERPNMPEQLTDVQSLLLPRLTETEMAELGAAMLGEAGRQQAIVDLIQRETEGNAFFAVEVLRALAENVGRLGDIGQTPLPEQLFPDGIQTIVDQRLNRLPSAALPLLQQAAITGRELDMALISALADEIDINGWWLSACGDAAILEVQNGRWQFTHDKIRQGVLHALSSELHTHYHAKVAQAYEAVYPNLPEMAAAVAQHWQAANEPEEEQQYRLTAAFYALGQYAFQNALSHFNRAYLLTSDDDKEAQFDILDGQIKSLSPLGWKEQEAEKLPQLAALAEEIGEPEKIVIAVLRQIEFQNLSGDYQISAELAQQIFERFEAQAVPNLIELYPSWASCYHRQGKNQEALALLDRVTPLLHGTNTQNEVKILVVRAGVEFNTGKFETAIAYLNKAVELAKKLNFSMLSIGALNNLGVYYDEAKEIGKAADCFEQAFELNQHVGNQTLQSILLINLGVCRFNSHDYAASNTLLEQAGQAAELMGLEMNKANVAESLGNFAYVLGRFDEGLKYAQQCLGIIEVIAKDNAYLNGNVWRLIADCHFYLKQWDEAKKAFQISLGYCEQHGLKRTVVETEAGLARTTLALENPKLALVQLQSVLSFLESLDGPSFGDLYLYLICYEILRHEDGADAEMYLRVAHRLLTAEDEKITNEESRRIFWEEHVVHREIVRLYEAINENGA